MLILSTELIAQNKRPSHVKGELMIQLTTEAYQVYKSNYNAKGLSTGLRQIDQLNSEFEVKEIKPLYHQINRDLAKNKNGIEHRSFMIKVDESVDILEMKRTYEQLKEIVKAEPNHIYYLHMPPGQGNTSVSKAKSSNLKVSENNNINNFPNDQYFDQENGFLQWGHENPGNNAVLQYPYEDSTYVGDYDCDADTKEAWAYTTGSSNVTIAFIDTGIDYNHPEFIGRIRFDHAYNSSTETFGAQDDHGHGTLAAGIAAAKGNNSIGVAGVDWNCKILPIKATSENDLTNQAVINGLNYAAGKSYVRIISMSFGGPSYNSFYEEAVDSAHAAGKILFAASGNDNYDIVDYPSAYDNVISVGALSPCNTRKASKGNTFSPAGISCDNDDRKDKHATQNYYIYWGSNFEDGKLDFVAPSVLLPTTDIMGAENGYSQYVSYYQSDNNGNYVYDTYGTSMASPFAAGIAALMLSVNPELSNVEVRAMMQATCVDIQDQGYDAYTGYGRVNALNAVKAALGICEDNLIISNQTISNETFTASQTIQVGPNVQSSGVVALIADQEITITDLDMTPGAELEASIQNQACDLQFNEYEGAKLADEYEVDNLQEQSSFEQTALKAYPNPFSQELRLEYWLIESSKVSITMYDQLGNMVLEQRLEENQAPGVHTIQINTSLLQQGLYSCKIQMGSETKAIRVIKY